MCRRYLMVAVILVVLLAGARYASPQSGVDGQKFEAGGQFATLNLESQIIVSAIPVQCFVPPCPSIPTLGVVHHTDPGLGGRFGYLLGNYITLEAELNFFPSDRIFEQGRKLEGLFGAKVGRRFRKIGFFGKARPGFLYASRGDFQPKPNIACITIFPPPLGCFDAVGKTAFAFDIGGVVEIYPSRRTILRFDAGDTIVRFRDRRVAVDVDPQVLSLVGPSVLPRTAETTHNLQLSAGFSFRF
jgi:hypothetical protein